MSQRYTSLDHLLRHCTVRIDTPSRGTGFFVAPGLILTCAHVVKDGSSDKPITLTWQSNTYTAQAVKLIPAPNVVTSQGTYPYPDIALLKIDVMTHPCVYLHMGVDLLQPLASYGYPRPDPLNDLLPGGQYASFGCESYGFITAEQPFIKFKEGQVEPGLSGAPLLNLRTGGVCGMVKRTRDQMSDLGGYGVPTKIIFDQLPELIVQHQQYHRYNATWGALLNPEQRGLLDWVGVIRDPNNITVNTWKACTPPTDYVRALAIDPQQPNLLYAGMSNGGRLYRSIDGGVSWEIHNAELAVSDINCIVPSYHEEKVYVGTDRGLFVSVNQGETWHLDQRYSHSDVLCVGLSPHDRNFLSCGTRKSGGGFVAAATSSVVTNIATGLRKSQDVNSGHFHMSIDGGRTWTTLNIGTVTSAVVSPLDSSIIFLGTGSDGLFRSLDGGDQFLPVKSFPVPNINRVALSPHNIELVLVGTLHHGLYISYDMGESWSHVELAGDDQICAIVVSPIDPQYIIVATRVGVIESRDGGATWKAVNNNLVHRWAMDIALALDGTAYVGTSGGGVYKRGSGKLSWQEMNVGFVSSISITSLLVASDNLLYVGTPIGLYRTTNGGNTWRLMAYFDSGNQHTNPETVWSLVRSDSLEEDVPFVNYSGFHVSTDAGSSWQRPASANIQTMLLGATDGHLYRSTNAGATWQRVAGVDGNQVWALVIDRQNPGRIFAIVNGAGVFRSNDAGVTWQSMNDGLNDLRITSLLVSRKLESILFAGTAKGKLYRSDDGTTWSQLPVELPEKAIFSIIESEYISGRMYLTTDGAGIYRNDSSNSTWEPINEGLDNQRVLALVEAPEMKGALYAGTWNGVYRSKDGGMSWQQFNNGLPPTPHVVNRLAFSPVRRNLLFGGMREGLFKILIED